MKKFVGLVNGKSFDNEKDFNEAAKKAIQANEENLSISSYYSYSEDSEQEQVNEKEDVKYLPSSEYILVNQEPEVRDKNLVYPVTDELTNKILEASNDGDIKENAQRLIGLYEKQVKNEEEEIKTIESQIERLQTKLYDKENSIKNLNAKQDYYNAILDILSKKEPDKIEAKDEPDEKEEKKTITREDIRNIFGSTSLFDTLRQLGLFM